MPTATRRIGRAALVAAAVLIAAGPFLSAHAQKEQFERSKPHVNVGTIGKATPPTSATTGLTLAPEAANDCEPPDNCPEGSDA